MSAKHIGGETSEDLESRVRDLEERDRASAASRQAMHKQLGDINCKLDMMLSKQDEKADECAEHRTQTALMEKTVQIFEKDRAADKVAAEKALKAVGDEVIYMRRTAFGALITALLAICGALWALLVK